MRYFHSANKESGFELVEVVLASAVLSLSLLAVIAIGGRSIIVSRKALETYTASTLLEEGAEAVRTVRDGGWINISGLTGGTTYYPVFNTGTNSWTLSTSPSDGTVGIYTRSVVMSAVNRNASDDISDTGSDDPGTKLFTETISWDDEGPRSETLSFYLMDIFSGSGSPPPPAGPSAPPSAPSAPPSTPYAPHI